MVTRQLDHPVAITRLGALHRRPRPASADPRTDRVVRLGTTDAVPVPLLAPAVRAFRTAHADARVEVVTAGTGAVRAGLGDGALHLGLVDLLDGDAAPPGLEVVQVARAAPVVVLRADDPLASRERLTVDDLRGRPHVAARPGSTAHRATARLLGDRAPTVAATADRLDVALLLVAQGTGLAVVPGFGVVDDPLVRAGVLTHRPVAPDAPGTRLALVRRRAREDTRATRDLHRLIAERADRLPEAPRDRSPALVAG